MFIIFGMRSISTTTSSGEFRCPGCKQDRPYEAKSYRRWFTLFFIPVIPLDSLGEAIECQVCRSSYSVEVLAIPTTVQVTQAYFAAIRCLVAGMGRINESRNLFPAAQQIANGLKGYDIKAIEADVQALGDPEVIKMALSNFAAMTDENGRSRIVECAIFLAAQDGVITNAELGFIHEAASAMGIPQPYVHGMISAYLNMPKEVAEEGTGGAELNRSDA